MSLGLGVSAGVHVKDLGSCPAASKGDTVQNSTTKLQLQIQNTAAYASRVQNPRRLYDDLTVPTVPVAFDWVGANSSTASTCSVS